MFSIYNDQKHQIRMSDGSCDTKNSTLNRKNKLHVKICSNCTLNGFYSHKVTVFKCIFDLHLRMHILQFCVKNRPKFLITI